MSGSILDPLSGGRGRKRDLPGRVGAAGRDQLWDE
jgi:hypothetical protein